MLIQLTHHCKIDGRSRYPGDTLVISTNRGRGLITGGYAVMRAPTKATKLAVAESKKFGIDLSELIGSGHKGRIVCNDIYKAVCRRSAGGPGEYDISVRARLHEGRA